MSAGPVTKAGASWRLAVVRPALIGQFVLYVGGYAALLGWFKSVDVYHVHFADTGGLILAHNLFRILFVFYLFWMVQAAGAILLRLIGGLRPEQVGMASYLAMTFFAGTGIWQVVLFAGGYAGLLNAPVMIVLATPMVAASFGDFRAAIPALHMSLTRAWQSGALTKTLVVLLFLSWVALLIVKGLYPGNGLMYAPYFQTYKTFLEQGSLWPHAAWWYSLYCQGVGLFFLGMLLTDVMAVSAVMFCLVSVAGLVTLLFIRRFAPRGYWPLVGTALLFATFVYTPGWGDFRELHEFNTAFVIAIFWMTATGLNSTGRQRKTWLLAAASTLTAAIIAVNYIGVFLGAVFAVLALVYFALGERHRALACFGLAALSGFLIAGTLVINYLVYGLFNGWDPTLPLLWRFADVEKVYHFGALPMVIGILNRVSQDTSAGAHIPWAGFLIRALRLEIFWPLFLGGGLAAAIALRDRFSDGKVSGRRIPGASLVLVVALAVYVPLALVVGRSQAGSFFRFSSFTIPVVIIGGIALWTVTLRRPRAALLGWVGGPAGPIAVLLLCGVMLAGKTRFDPGVPRLALRAIEYTIGAISIDEAYTEPSVGGRTVPWAGVYPGARGVYAVVGPHTLVWSLNANAFCELPDCDIVWSLTSILVPGIDRVIWGTPEEARAALQKAGVSYFVVSRAMRLGHEPFLQSQLFSPDNIGKIFGIRWTDGTTTLLTWVGPTTAAIDEKWLAGYRTQLAESYSPLARARTTEVGAGFDRLRAIPHPWHPSDVPWRQEDRRNVPIQ